VRVRVRVRVFCVHTRILTSHSTENIFPAAETKRGIENQSQYPCVKNGIINILVRIEINQSKKRKRKEYSL